MKEQTFQEYCNRVRQLEKRVKALEQEPCEDTISRQAVFDALDKSKYSNEFCEEHHIDWSINLGMAHIVVNELKPVIPQPKTGHWISVNTGKQIHLKDGRVVESVKCSECDEWLIASDEYDCNGNYCPNCGAKMI